MVVPSSDRKEYVSLLGNIGIQINDDFFVCPTSREELMRFGTINHSCEPNAGVANILGLTAIKDIEKGQEIVLDFAFYETIFDPFQCNCGSKNCRKVIKPTDWKNKNLQKKYGKYFSPYLREKFKK